MPMVESLPFQLAPHLHFRKLLLARFNSWDQFFFTFFKTFPTIALGVSVKLLLGQR